MQSNVIVAPLAPPESLKFWVFASVKVKYVSPVTESESVIFPSAAKLSVSKNFDEKL